MAQLKIKTESHIPKEFEPKKRNINYKVTKDHIYYVKPCCKERRSVRRIV